MSVLSNGTDDNDLVVEGRNVKHLESVLKDEDKYTLCCTQSGSASKFKCEAFKMMRVRTFCAQNLSRQHPKQFKR